MKFFLSNNRTKITLFLLLLTLQPKKLPFFGRVFNITQYKSILYETTVNFQLHERRRTLSEIPDAPHRRVPRKCPRSGFRPLCRHHLFLRRIRSESAGPFCGIRHQGTFRTPFERSPAYDPRGAGHLRRRRQHLRPDQENAGAGAVESHPRQDQGRHALHRPAATSAARRSAPPTTCPSSNRNRSRLSGP